MTDEIGIVTDNIFEQKVIQADLPVIVDFWAAWCAPCLMISPELVKLARKLPEKIKIFKMNVDENPEIPVKFGIMSIPTLLFFKQGELKETIIGVQSMEKIYSTIEKHL